MSEVISLNIDSLSTAVLKLLLKDKTTQKNIIWATDNYKELGIGYFSEEEILPENITGFNKDIIQPRVCKALEEQAKRTRSKAEVFTPSWICNKMNNHCDEEWFGVPNIFNVENGKTWTVQNDKVKHPEGRTWKDYVESTRIEITCGEAPYIVSRYDAATGEYIEIPNRIGILDRKLRIVNENTDAEEEWLEWVFNAFRSVYGYEYQGDNLLIARFNLISTFNEYLQDRWNRKPADAELKKLANIISWNFWQMDGISNTIPYGVPEEDSSAIDLSSLMPGFWKIVGAETEKSQCEAAKETPVCRIYDWKANKSILFTDLKKGRN